MTQFLLHLTLALLWVLLWGHFDLYTFLAGVVVGFLLFALLGRTTRGSFVYPVRQVATLGYPKRVWRLVRFAVYFLRILVVANWQVARLVLSPRMPIHPRFIRYEVGDLTPVQVTTLAATITLTPGTLAADLSPDGRFLYIHCINAPDAARAAGEVDELKQHLLSEVFT
jgi:multicomponent Na+:H+ antiporter subunit E